MGNTVLSCARSITNKPNDETTVTTMMKILASFVLLLSGSSLAFTPSTTTSNSRNVVVLQAEKSQSLPFMNKPALLDGSMAGDFGFDPLGLSESGGVGVDLYWLREAELKHCRLAMMAAAGFIFVEAVGTAPGCEMATSKNQIDAFWELYAVHPQYIWAGFIFTALIELITGIAITSGRASGKRDPGDFGLDPFKCKGTAKWDKYALQEVQNGRLAMWAAAGEILQGCTTSDGALGNLFN